MSGLLDHSADYVLLVVVGSLDLSENSRATTLILVNAIQHVEDILGDFEVSVKVSECSAESTNHLLSFLIDEVNAHSCLEYFLLLEKSLLALEVLYFAHISWLELTVFRLRVDSLSYLMKSGVRVVKSFMRSGRRRKMFALRMIVN